MVIWILSTTQYFKFYYICWYRRFINLDTLNTAFGFLFRLWFLLVCFGLDFSLLVLDWCVRSHIIVCPEVCMADHTNWRLRHLQLQLIISLEPDFATSCFYVLLNLSNLVEQFMFWMDLYSHSWCAFLALVQSFA